MTHRIFARAELNSRVIIEYPDADAVYETDAGGTEVTYDPSTDSFAWAGGSGISPMIHTPNPFPGHILAGAARVASMADAHWAQGW